MSGTTSPAGATSTRTGSAPVSRDSVSALAARRRSWTSAGRSRTAVCCSMVTAASDPLQVGAGLPVGDDRPVLVRLLALVGQVGGVEGVAEDVLRDVVGLELVERLVEGGRQREVAVRRQLFRGELVGVPVDRLAGVELALDAVQPGGQDHRDAQVVVDRAVGGAH